MNNIQKTAELGQSIWLDYIKRSFITSGDLGKLIDLGVTGITSNPTIFEKAITCSSDYDVSMEALIQEGRSTFEIYDELTREDIGMAADLLRPVYEASGGQDGYVSLEVNPHLARDTESTVNEGVRLFTTTNRPNIMIKVPATPEGIPAVEELIRKGINVNVTLIFSLQQYQDAAQAYIVGLKKRAAEDRPIDTVASVASFFISRVDTAVDRLLVETGRDDMRGRTAIANARVAYTRFMQIFSGHDWEGISSEGGRFQRPLWASTSTKDPELSQTLYVDALIGPHTVNTLPMETLRSFQDNGTPSAAISESLDKARHHFEQLKDLGIDIERITAELLVKGVDLFATSFDSLLEGISRKAEKLRSGKTHLFLSTPAHDDRISRILETLDRERFVSRLSDRDHTLWKEDPAEITNRLGWLNSPGDMKNKVSSIRDLADEVRKEGYTDALLLGMGGSSLAPDLFRRTFETRPGYLNLRVLDSTDPAAVRGYARHMDLSRTIFIVSTKSGTTTETLSLFRYFYNLVTDHAGPGKAGEHFVAITDPGSPLQGMAEQQGFRKTFLNDPEIGGRYSALSYFGLVPAGLMGIDIDLLLDRAINMSTLCLGSGSRDAKDNPGAVLGGLFGEFHNIGVNKLTFIISPPIAAFGAWAEQLLAESTGKEGIGILPIDGELPGKPELYGKDRLFVYLRLTGDDTFDSMAGSLEKDNRPVIRIELPDMYSIASEFFRWEVATAGAGHVMGINPFDQPDVESAKVQTRQMLAEYRVSGVLSADPPALSESGIEVYSDASEEDLEGAVKGFLAGSGPGGYVALQAYLNPVPETALALGELRHAIREKYHAATTVGFGPRFLHSTGQLHKGDGGNGLFIQITADDAEDVPIPDEPGKEASTISFGVLKAAQAMGDLKALADAGRKVIRFHLKKDVVEGIRLIKERMG